MVKLPVRWKKPRMAVSSVTSSRAPSAPSASALTAASTRSWLLEPTVTRAPRETAWRATARPMPDVPPMTTTRLPLSDMTQIPFRYERPIRPTRAVTAHKTMAAPVKAAPVLVTAIQPPAAYAAPEAAEPATPPRNTETM